MEMSQGVVNEMPASAAPEQMERVRAEAPHIYKAGDCWRFRWAGEDRGSFDTEQDARSAAQRFKQQTMMKFVAQSLHLR
jgi:hypothetical protein